jgi:hypothetical protein
MVICAICNKMHTPVDPNAAHGGRVPLTSVDFFCFVKQYSALCCSFVHRGVQGTAEVPHGDEAARCQSASWGEEAQAGHLPPGEAVGFTGT